MQSVMSGKKMKKVAYYSFWKNKLKHKSRHTPIANRINSKYASGGPPLISSYNGNASDSEDEDHKMRNALGEHIRSMDAPLTQNESRIINYIITKKQPVYGFVQFSFDSEVI